MCITTFRWPFFIRKLPIEMEWINGLEVRNGIDKLRFVLNCVCLFPFCLFLFVSFLFLLFLFLLSCVIRGLWCCLSARIIYEKEILGVKSRSLTIDLSGKKNHDIQYSKMLPKIRYFQNAWSEKAACLLHSYLILLL